jgi:hypothetical protein
MERISRCRIQSTIRRICLAKQKKCEKLQSGDRSWYTDYDTGFESRQQQQMYFFSKSPNWLQDARSFLANGYPEFFPGVKRSRREIRHQSPSSANV